MRRLFMSSEYLSGQRLSVELGISRSAVWQHIQGLRARGYEIEALPRCGYRIVSTPGQLVKEEIKRNLRTSILGRKIIDLDCTTSTNDLARREARRGAKEGLVVLAEEQTKGRGRRGRSWYSSPGGIYFSLLLRPRLEPGRASSLTLLAAVSMVELLAQLYGLEAGIKWPNDIILEGKKLAGILTEMGADTESIDYLIIGIGLNANQRSADWPEEIAELATSLRIQLGKEVDRALIAAGLLERMEALYSSLGEKGAIESMIARAREYSVLLGKAVTIKTIHEKFRGQALDLTPEGALLVRRENGKKEKLWAGDVSIGSRESDNN